MKTKIFFTFEMVIPKYASPKKVNLPDNLKIYYPSNISDSLMRVEFLFWHDKLELKYVINAFVSYNENIFHIQAY